MNPSMQNRSDVLQTSGAGAAVPQPRRLTSDELLRGERRLIIEHGEARYTLLLTRNGKLILTK